MVWVAIFVPGMSHGGQLRIGAEIAACSCENKAFDQDRLCWMVQQEVQAQIWGADFEADFSILDLVIKVAAWAVIAPGVSLCGQLLFDAGFAIDAAGLRGDFSSRS